MEFCVCGNSTCICETSCTCLWYGCLCYKCHKLRNEEWNLPFETIGSSEFELFSPNKELAQSFSDVGISKSEFSSRPPAAQEIHHTSSSSEVNNEIAIDTGLVPGFTPEVSNEVIIESVPGSSSATEVAIDSGSPPEVTNKVIIESAPVPSFCNEVAIDPGLVPGSSSEVRSEVIIESGSVQDSSSETYSEVFIESVAGSSFGNEVIIETVPGLSFEVASEVIIESIPGSSFEVDNEVVIESESSISEIDSKAKDLQQVSSNKKLTSAEQESAPVQDIGTNETFQPKPCSSGYSTKKHSFYKPPHRRKKQVNKTVKHMKRKSFLSEDDSDCYSDKYFDAEAYNMICSRIYQSQRDEPHSEKSSSDTTSTSSSSSSGISIIDFPDDDWDPNAVPYLPDNHLIGISSIQFTRRHIDNSYPQRQESTTPNAMHSGENEQGDSSGRSISPIEMFTKNPTAVVSYSGELYLLPLRGHHSRSSPPETPQSPLMDVSQSQNPLMDISQSHSPSMKVSQSQSPSMNISQSQSPSMNVSQSQSPSKDVSQLPSLDSTIKASASEDADADTSEINMQNPEKLQTKCKKTSSSLESCTSNVQKNEQEKDNACLEKRENLLEKNSTNVHEKFKPGE